jgi:hypothetical protein
MANTFKIKRSAVPSKVPSTGDLQLGELALNTYDGKLYTKKDNGTASVVEIGGGGGSGSGSGVTVSNAAPTGAATEGSLHLDNVLNIFYVYSGGSWRPIYLSPLRWNSGGFTWSSGS